MAVDYGIKRTGLAATDPLQLIASPLETVPTPELMSFLETYLRQEAVDKIVIGMPVDLRGQDTDATPHVKGFIKRLKKAFPDISLEEMDERFTSKMAKDSLLASGRKKKDRQQKGELDKISAAIILQSYLEKQSF